MSANRLSTNIENQGQTGDEETAGQAIARSEGIAARAAELGSVCTAAAITNEEFPYGVTGSLASTDVDALLCDT